MILTKCVHPLLLELVVVMRTVSPDFTFLQAHLNFLYLKEALSFICLSKVTAFLASQFPVNHIMVSFSLLTEFLIKEQFAKEKVSHSSFSKTTRGKTDTDDGLHNLDLKGF